MCIYDEYGSFRCLLHQTYWLGLPKESTHFHSSIDHIGSLQGHILVLYILHYLSAVIGNVLLCLLRFTSNVQWDAKRVPTTFSIQFKLWLVLMFSKFSSCWYSNGTTGSRQTFETTRTLFLILLFARYRFHSFRWRIKMIVAQAT
jgi:hypothetical protein